MTGIIQRIRRKRKVSSELDSRWGDMSISSPNDGSWSQYEGGSARASPVSARSSDRDHAHGPKKHPGGSSERYLSPNGRSSESRKGASVNSSLSMPTGYYDAKLQRQAKTKTRPPKPRPVQPKHLTLPKAWEDKKFGDCSADEAEDNISALGSPRGRQGTDDSNSRGSKSPPLSVTSRMRRLSGQSTVTDPVFSVPGTASSQRTSFSDDSRLARHQPSTPQYDKKPPQGVAAKVRDAGPIPASQELVPSYDDLYG
ncbi:hypothetical protein BDW62DRAFT_53865 [Aspergillus aurantiobrunneus]